MDRKPAGAREIALKALREIEDRGGFPDAVLDRFFSRCRPPRVERALATELVYGTLRRRNTLDWHLERHASRPLSQMTPWIRNLLRLSAYQLMYLDRIPAAAAVHEAVELARKYGHAGSARLVNAVLRALTRQTGIPYPDPERDPAGYVSLKHSHPQWLVNRWLDRYGFDETVALCEENNRPAPVAIRPNRLKTTAAALAAELAREGVEVRPGAVVPEALVMSGYDSLPALEAFRRGLFQVQDEGAMVAGLAVAPLPGETVIDACSAPGGKTTHLAELMDNRGRIVAADIHEFKLPLIRENCERLGIDIVTTVCADGRQLGRLYPGEAARVLVDAPCSGTGVLRRNPDARWRKGPEGLSEFHALQVELLQGAAGCVRPEGVLVYCTCSLEPEENDRVVAEFLQRNADFMPDDLRPFLPPSLRAERGAAEGHLQLLPQRHGTDGFFIARMRRVR